MEKALTVTSRFITIRNAPQRVTGGSHSHKATTRPSDVLCFGVKLQKKLIGVAHSDLDIQSLLGNVLNYVKLY